MSDPEFDVSVEAPAAPPAMQVSVGVDTEAVKALEPNLWQRVMRVLRRYTNHLLYKLHLKKF